MASPVGRGYLVLADISGFTRFVADSELDQSGELDHSRAILSDILKLIVGRFSPRLRVAEIEGDAVFAYVLEDDLSRGETLLEIIEATYVDFRDKQRSGLRMATCTCTACQTSGELDLKFITHYGDFVLQDIQGRKKPLGTSVNLLHRLTKNKVRDHTGWRGYALFTDESLISMDVHPLNVHEEVENYEHIGEVKTFSMDLDHRYQELVSDRNVVLGEDDAHYSLTKDLPASPDEVWEWLNDPRKRVQWMIGSDWQADDRPGGRTTRGATNHCNNSGAVECVLDWKPFSYYTVELLKNPMRALVTVALEPIASGTRVSWRIRLNSFLPRWILCPLCRLIAVKGPKTPQSFDLLERILAGQNQDARAIAM